MHNYCMGATAPGLVTPELTAHEEATGQGGFIGQSKDDKADSHATGIADQATLVIEGEAYALAYIERLDRGTVQPGELAALLSFLAGEMLHGACRVIEKALEGQRNA